MTRRLIAVLAALLAAACSRSSTSDTPQRQATPAPTILVPQSGALLGLVDLSSGKVAFSGTAQAGTTVSLEVDAVAVCTTATSGSTWSCVATLADGTHTARARATGGGGTSDYSSAVGFTLDMNLPAAPVVLTPAAGAHLAAADLSSGQVVISGTAQTDATVVIDLDGFRVATVAVATGGVWSTTATVGTGVHVASARALSPAGNPSAAATASFTLSLARLASAVVPAAPVPVACWGQTVADVSGLREAFPGQANTWMLDRDFSLAGFASQYSHALQVRHGAITTPVTHATLTADFAGGALAAFPYDQAASEVAFLSPRFGTADGVETAVVSDGASVGLSPLAGSYSGFLNGTSDSRLSRTLPFDPGHVYTISWTHDVLLNTGLLLGVDAAPYAPRYQVVLRDPADGSQIGDPLYVSTAGYDYATPSISVSGASVPALAVLSFELRGEPLSSAMIDLLTIDDGSGPVDPGNGGFELGLLDPWVANTGAELQNVRSGPRTVGAGGSALKVTRTIYAPPATTWARVVDVFENEGASTVATSAVYSTLLGGSAAHAASRASGAAVVGWDAAGAVRDVGLVLGGPTAHGTAYLSAGDPQIFVVHDLVVPPGGRVALVHFVVQLGEVAVLTTSGLPTNTEAVCGAIVDGFPTVNEYWNDLEPGVMEAIKNF
jgi:hypothetical protein